MNNAQLTDQQKNQIQEEEGIDYNAANITTRGYKTIQDASDFLRNNKDDNSFQGK